MLLVKKQASSISNNSLKYCSSHNKLKKLSNATSTDLWAAVGRTRNTNYNSTVSSLLGDPNDINAHFVKIASKDAYDCRELHSFHRTVDACILSRLLILKLSIC